MLSGKEKTLKKHALDRLQDVSSLRGGNNSTSSSAYAYMKQRTDLEKKLERFEKEQRKKLKSIVRDTTELHRFMDNLKVASSFDVETRVLFRKNSERSRGMRSVSCGSRGIVGAHGEGTSLAAEIRQRVVEEASGYDERLKFPPGFEYSLQKNINRVGISSQKPRHSSCVRKWSSASELFSDRNSRQPRRRLSSRTLDAKNNCLFPECNRVANPDGRKFDDDCRTGSRQAHVTCPNPQSERLGCSAPKNVGKSYSKTLVTMAKNRRFQTEVSCRLSDVESRSEECINQTTNTGKAPKCERVVALNLHGAGLGNVLEDVTTMATYDCIESVSQANQGYDKNAPPTLDRDAVPQDKWSAPLVDTEMRVEEFESFKIGNHSGETFRTTGGKFADTGHGVQRSPVPPPVTSSESFESDDVPGNSSPMVDYLSSPVSTVSRGDASRTGWGHTRRRAQSSKLRSNFANRGPRAETNPLMTGQVAVEGASRARAAVSGTFPPTGISPRNHWDPRNTRSPSSRVRESTLKSPREDPEKQQI